MHSENHKLVITRGNLPHWTFPGSIYFLTFRTMAGNLSFNERQIVFNHIIKGKVKYYCLIAFVVMPDHVHLVLQPKPGFSLSRIMHGIKGVSARLLNRSRNIKGNVWQDESFDRIIRDNNELHEKINYMHYNPVKTGLVENPDDYPFRYFNKDWEDNIE